MEPWSYQVEVGRLDSRDRGYRLPIGNGPAELLLTEDTHVDYVTGVVTPPEADGTQLGR